MKNANAINYERNRFKQNNIYYCWLSKCCVLSSILSPKIPTGPASESSYYPVGVTTALASAIVLAKISLAPFSFCSEFQNCLVRFPEISSVFFAIQRILWLWFKEILYNKGIGVYGWYEISILAAPCHCVLCFCPKLDSLLVLKGCYLNIAIHGALQEKRCVAAALFQISGHFKRLWSAMVRFLYKLKKPSEKIAGTLPHIAFSQGQRVFTSQWSFTPNNFKWKQQRRMHSKTHEIHGEHEKT